jgi:hypothetical protein
MPDPSCLIIDDVDGALATMSELGRAIVSEAAADIRAAVRTFAARRGWMVVAHASYVAWASDAMKNDPRPWITLDPLFPINADGVNAQRLRVSREFDSESSLLTKGFVQSTEVTFDSNANSTAGVVDDVAASGRTFRFALKVLTDAGSNIGRVLVCASSREAREGLRASVPGVQWAEYLRGDWRVCHLRDGCPHLPFSGRPNGIISGEGGMAAVEARVLPTHVTGNLWQVLALDPAVRSAIRDGRRHIVARLTDAVGEPARVSHLPRLGAGVAALVTPNQVVTHDSVLEGLLE